MKKLGVLFTRGSLFGDLAQSSLIGIVVLGCTVIAQGIAARIFNAEDLAIYLLVRRINLAIVPLVILGMSLALMRYMPLFAKQGRAGRQRLFEVTFGMVFVSGVVSWLVLTVFQAQFAQLFFKGSENAYMIRPLLFYVVGSVCSTHVAAYFQGRIWMKVVNLLQFLAAGVVQIIVLTTIPKAGVAAIIEVSGIAILCVGVVFLFMAAFDAYFGAEAASAETLPTRLDSLREMLAYGLPRVPSFLGTSGLWLAGPLLIVQLGGLEASRYLVTALSLLQVIVVPFKPATFVFLPRFAEMKAQGRSDDISRLVSIISDMLIQLGLLGCTQLVIFIPLILRAWMQFTDPRAYTLATIIALAVPAHLVFAMLRSQIDSYSKVSYNTYTILGSLALMVLLAGVLARFMEPDLAVAWATSIAFMVLGLATYLITRWLMVKPGTVLGNRGYASAVLTIAVLAGVGLAIKAALAGQGEAVVLTVILLWALTVTAIFAFVQIRFGVMWAKELRERIKKRK